MISVVVVFASGPKSATFSRRKVALLICRSKDAPRSLPCTIHRELSLVCSDDVLSKLMLMPTYETFDVVYVHFILFCYCAL